MHNYKFVYLFLLIFAIVFSACEKTNDSVIDPTLSFPVIHSAYVTPNTIDSAYLGSFIGAKVSSDLPVSSVTARISNPDNTEIFTVDLKDDGAAPDSAAGDGKFTARMNFNLDCRVVGLYKVEIIAKNNSGLASNVFNVPFNVTNSHNAPPFVTGFFVSPHDVVTGNGGTFISFWTIASDPDGLCDINRVECTGIKPDNSAITPFNLFDDGKIQISGDTTAIDGHFTRATFGEPTQNGYYRYFVRAYDRSGDSSNVLADSIFVHP